jgi:hypothetical protein
MSTIFGKKLYDNNKIYSIHKIQGRIFVKTAERRRLFCVSSFPLQPTHLKPNHKGIIQVSEAVGVVVRFEYPNFNAKGGKPHFSAETHCKNPKMRYN